MAGYVIVYHDLFCNANYMVCSVMLCHDRCTLCCHMLLHVALGRDRRYDMMSCYDMLCDAVSWYDMVCQCVLWYIRLCYVM